MACIGPAGEKVSLIACRHEQQGARGRALGPGRRHGLQEAQGRRRAGQPGRPDGGAGRSTSKRCASGTWAPWQGIRPSSTRRGTPGIYDMCCKIDDAPAKNWSGVAEIDSPNYEDCRGANVVAKQKRRYGCWRCPIACGGIMKAGAGEYAYEEGAHKPEYETMAMFGSNCCNDNLDSLIVANDICNRWGSRHHLGRGLRRLRHRVLRERPHHHRRHRRPRAELGRPPGHHRADRDDRRGVRASATSSPTASKIAAERIGKGSERYAMHVGGQEIGAHDPRGGWGFATGYGADPTPGRHNQGGGQHPPGLDIPEVERDPARGPGAPSQDQHQLHARHQRPGHVPVRHRLVPARRSAGGGAQGRSRAGRTSPPKNCSRQASASPTSVTLSTCAKV